MSVMNNALADIAKKDGQRNVSLQKAQVKPVQSSNRWAWALGGFALSLCLGGWAVSKQGNSTVVATPEPLAAATTVESSDPAQKSPADVRSPTSKVVDSPVVTLYSEPLVKAETTTKPSAMIAQNSTVKSDAAANVAQGKLAAKNETSSSNATEVVIAKASVNPELSAVKQPPRQQTKQSHSAQSATASQKIAKTQKVAAVEPQLEIAQATSSSEEPRKEATATMAIEQVELTPQQLASKAIERGKKELDSNNLDSAIKEFEVALRYTPSDEQNRKRLAALYYGSNNFRKSVDTLQRGIKLNKDSQELRLALSNLLIKEGQPAAALTSLLYLPEQASIDYLAMRAALAQQLKNSEIAYESYQILVQKEDENARWWLGLAIGQERKSEYQSALYSYQQAMQRVGVSKQTVAFIQERVKLLNSLEVTSSDN